MRKRLLVLVGLLALPLLDARAQAAGVKVGDAAPPLKIAEWVRGTPVDLQAEAGKKLHLVEFWATWCPPCKASIPLLSQLQKKFEKDLVIVGVTDPDPYENSPTEIKQFVKKQGTTMDYTVAMDDRSATSEAYLSADEPAAIPQAFLVARDGRVVWQGSPLDPALDGVITQVIGGKYDVAAAQKVADQQRDIEKRFQALETAFRMGQIDVVWNGLMDIIKIDPTNEMAMHLLSGISSEEDGYAEKFRAWATRHIKEHASDVKAMGALATTLLYIEDLSQRMPDVALEAAKAAYEASGKTDPPAIAVYAQALYQVGALDRAIDLQSMAVARSDEDSRKAATGVLNFYQACKKLQTAQ